MNQEKVIPKDLADQLINLKFFVQIHNLLTANIGFQVKDFDDVVKSIAFLRGVGDKLILEMMNHPNFADLPDYELIKVLQEDSRRKNFDDAIKLKMSHMEFGDKLVLETPKDKQGNLKAKV